MRQELKNCDSWLHKYSCSDPLTGSTISPYGVMTLVKKIHQPRYQFHRLPTDMGRLLLIAEINIDDELFAIGNVHLESLNNRDVRQSQLQVCSEVLKIYSNRLLCGDFNFCSLRNYDGSFPLENDILQKTFPHFHDMWPSIRPPEDPGYTFDTVKNTMLVGHNYERMRYDRILFNFRSELTTQTVQNQWEPQYIDVIGTEPIINPQPHIVKPEDCNGLLGKLAQALEIEYSTQVHGMQLLTLCTSHTPGSAPSILTKVELINWYVQYVRGSVGEGSAAAADVADDDHSSVLSKSNAAVLTDGGKELEADIERLDTVATMRPVTISTESMNTAPMLLPSVTTLQSPSQPWLITHDDFQSNAATVSSQPSVLASSSSSDAMGVAADYPAALISVSSTAEVDTVSIGGTGSEAEVSRAKAILAWEQVVGTADFVQCRIALSPPSEQSTQVPRVSAVPVGFSTPPKPSPSIFPSDHFGLLAVFRK